MTFKLINVARFIEKPTDRDNFMFKRIETPGVLLNSYLKYYKMMLQNIYKTIDKEYYYHVNQYQNEQFYI